MTKQNWMTECIHCQTGMKEVRDMDEWTYRWMMMLKGISWFRTYFFFLSFFLSFFFLSLVLSLGFFPFSRFFPFSMVLFSFFCIFFTFSFAISFVIFFPYFSLYFSLFSPFSLSFFLFSIQETFQDVNLTLLDCNFSPSRST